MAAGKLDLRVFLESVDAEDHTQDLLRHGVDSLAKLATLTQDKLRKWNIYFYDLQSAITKAQRLVKSSDAVVQEELLVSDTNLILEKKDWGLSISVTVLVRLKGEPVKGWDVDTSTCSTARCVLCYPVCVCTKDYVFGHILFVCVFVYVCVCVCV